MREQVYIDDSGVEVHYLDRRDTHHATKAQPRDIEILTPMADDQRKNFQFAITLDIRRGQGYPEVGLGKNMLWE